jgi:hypothetical protein
LQRRLAEVASIDFFDSSGREVASGLISALAQSLEGGGQARASLRPRGFEDLEGHTSVTRKGVHVDRISTAWLIRRFIDPGAGFKFVSGRGYRPSTNELRFDMFDGEFTHEGDRCTFEVLLARVGLDDPALQRIAEIVHDIDLRDGKFAAPETSGVERLVGGLAGRHRDDDVRLARGADLFDDLYESFRSKRR